MRFINVRHYQKKGIKMIDKIQINNKYVNSVSFKSKSQIVKKLIENPKTSTTLLSGIAGFAASAEIELNKNKIYDKLDINEVKRDLEAGFSISQLAKKYNMSSTSMRNYLKENNLSTKNGEILKTITKEDLERLIQEGKSSKEIAQIYGLKNAGTLTPLFKIFNLNPATAKKVENISEEELVEYKKKGLTDTEISEQLNVAPRYITERRNFLGVANIDVLKEYPEEEIKRLVEEEGLLPKEVAQKLNIPLKKVAEIVGGATPELIFRHKRDELIKFVESLDEKDFEDKDSWLMDQERGSRGSFRLTKQNIDLSTLILENEKLRKKNKDWNFTFDRMASQVRKNPSVYDDTTKFLKMVLEDDKLNILKDPKNDLARILNQHRYTSKEILEVYKKIISDDNLVEAVKLSPRGFERLKYIYDNPSNLINRIDRNKNLINKKPFNFYIMPESYNRYILENLGKDDKSQMLLDLYLKTIKD